MSRTERIPFYVRKFSHTTYEESDTKTYSISTYFPPIMRDTLLELIKRGKIGQNSYILGPVYKAGDIQIGVTGTSKGRETFYSAMIRELGEELGIYPVENKDMPEIYFDNRVKKYATYSLDVSKAENIAETLDGMIVGQGRDIKRNKVGVIVYGTKNDCLKYLNSKIYRFSSEDAIIGVGAIKVGDVKKVI